MTTNKYCIQESHAVLSHGSQKGAKYHASVRWLEIDLIDSLQLSVIPLVDSLKHSTLQKITAKPAGHLHPDAGMAAKSTEKMLQSVRWPQSTPLLCET